MSIFKELGGGVEGEGGGGDRDTDTETETGRTTDKRRTESVQTQNYNRVKFTIRRDCLKQRELAE